MSAPAQEPPQIRTPTKKRDLADTMGTRARMEVLMSEVQQDKASLDEMLDRATKRNNAPHFIPKFHPQASWLWRQWRGTVLVPAAKPAAIMMLVSVALVYHMEVARQDGTHTWTLFEVPDPNDKWVARMKGFTTMWGYLLTMATFVNSFFLSQAYGFWLATKGNVRKVQGRLNDLGMLVACHAPRDSATGRIVPASQEILDDVARWVRLYHMLFWAGQVRPARGDAGVSFSVLRTELGLQGLVGRGALTEDECELLTRNPRLAETQRHQAVLEWIVTRFVEGRESGALRGGVAVDARFLEEACKLRATCASISDDQVARMPLSYVHLVQLLVDTLIVLAPLALYPKLGILTVLLSPILVIFYRGFLQLSKSFLDPFGNDDSVAENLSVSCLICEVNSGSTRWFDAVQQLPFKTGQK